MILGEMYEGIKHIFKRTFTMKYPYQKLLLPKGFRGRHQLYMDKCTGCGICAWICPERCIKHIRAVVGGDTAALSGETRGDVRAATEGVAAARTDALRARSALLPRLNGFARYDWNSVSRPYAGDRSWTVGVMASWNLFSGASEIADIDATNGRAASARAQADAVQANARLDIEQTRIALGVALAQLDIAERAVIQSAEAHRIVSRKYEGGLASVVELLDAQSVETQSALALSQARWAAIAADAARRLALGVDPATLASLDEPNAVAEQGAQRNQ